MRSWKRKNLKEQRGWFFNNGSTLLQELIADSNGISNPIRFFSSDQILKATDGFEPKRDLSRHTLFTWYKGVIEDRHYAIKKFTESEFTAEREREVYNDIVLSARVSNHSRFLKLLGCSLEFPLPVMVFEYPENGVLNEPGGCVEGTLLPWNIRLRIAKEIAIAVTYLHTAFPRIIIHRDVKQTNVFLDENWKAKLTDFTFSVTLPVGKSWIWINDKVMGTFGYIDPVYAMTGFLTEYADVYSFGILMLVLLMGRPATFASSSGVHCNILDYVKHLRARGETVEFGANSNDMRPGQMKMFLDLALRCCEERNEDRPKMILVAKEIRLIEQASLEDCQI